MANNAKRILSVSVKVTPDECPDVSYLEQDGFEERLRQYHNDLFGFIGVKAEAKVQVTENRVVHRIDSGGLWGIESDSDKSYLQAVGREELSALCDELEAMGFSASTIKDAFDAAKWEGF